MNIGPLGLRIKPSTLPATLRTLQGVVRPGFTRWGSLAFSLGILAAVAFQLRSIDFITLTTLARIIRDVVRFGGPRFSVPACM